MRSIDSLRPNQHAHALLKALGATSRLCIALVVGLVLGETAGCSSATSEQTDNDDLTASVEPTLDTSFGEGGRLVIDDASASYLLALSTGDFVVGNGGRVRIVTSQGIVKGTTTIGEGGRAGVLDKQEAPDGKLFFLFGGGRLSRLSADASIDESFGDAGSVLMGSLPTGPVAGAYFYASSFVVDATGAILLGGSLYGGGKHYGSAMVRLRADGTLDTAFGDSGFLQPASTFGELAEYARVSSLNVQSDGSIMATVERVDENANSPTGSGFYGKPAAVIALAPNGDANRSFGTAGLAFLEQTGIPNYGGVMLRASFVVGATGDLLIQGALFNGGYGLARVEPGVGLDPDFGGGSPVLLSGTRDSKVQLTPEQARLVAWPSGIGARVLDYQYNRPASRADEGFCVATAYRPNVAPEERSWIVRRPGFDGFCTFGRAVFAPNGALLVATHYVNHGGYSAGLQLTLYK